MRLVRAHVEQRLGLAERPGDVVSRFVGIAMVDVGELLGVANKQERGCDADYGACKFLSQA